MQNEETAVLVEEKSVQYANRSQLCQATSVPIAVTLHSSYRSPLNRDPQLCQPAQQTELRKEIQTRQEHQSLLHEASFGVEYCGVDPFTKTVIEWQAKAKI